MRKSHTAYETFLLYFRVGGKDKVGLKCQNLLNDKYMPEFLETILAAITYKKRL